MTRSSDVTSWRSVFFLAVLVVSAAQPLQAQGLDPYETVSADVLRAWMAEVSNHGRWGADDQLGTLNLITPAHRLAAVDLVVDGVTVSLAHDLIAGPDENAIRPLEVEHIPFRGDPTSGALDRVDILYHGYAYSHLDALSHFAFDGSFYNGFGLETVSTEGASSLGVENIGDGIVTRAVLIDIPRLRGVDYLDLGDVVTVTDLEAGEVRTGIQVSEGDVLLIRTGRWAREAALGPWSVRQSSAGPHPSIGRWLRERGVAALGGDGANDRKPSLVEGVGDPLHQVTIVAMGMPLFDNLDLAAVAEAAAERDRWTFLFMASPLRLVGASGSPLNPIVMFE